MESKYVTIAKYVIENNSSWDDVCKEFKVDKLLIQQNFGSWNKKFPEIISKARQILKENTNQPKRYLEVAEYILNNKVGIKETAKHFNSNEDAIYSNIYIGLKTNNKELYNKVIKKIKSRTLKNRRFYKIAKFIIKNNATRKEVAKKFKIDKDYIGSALSNLKFHDKEKYDLAMGILRKNKKAKYIDIANYIIKNHATNKEVAKKFNIKENSVSGFLSCLVKKERPDLFEKIKEIRQKR